MSSPKPEPKTITAKPDVNGNIIVKHMGKEFDVTAIVKDGVARAKLFGQPYIIQVEGYEPESQ